MKAKHLIIILVYIFPLLSFWGCKKEEIKGGSHLYKLDENLYPMLFDKDSYWIYKNMDTNIIDSISLTEVTIDTTEYINIGHGFTERFQTFNLRYRSSITGEYSELYLGWTIRSESEDGGYIYLSSFHIGDSLRNARISNIYDSILVGEKIYYDVVEMNIKKDKYIDNDMNLFWADSIGVLKKEIKENNYIQSTWSLMYYNIKYLKVE